MAHSHWIYPRHLECTRKELLSCYNIQGTMWLTFMMEGNKSRWVKYDNKLVLYAPETTERATLIAFRRSSTIKLSQLIPKIKSQAFYTQFLPCRMIWSSEETNSVKTASTWSSPAMTLMISELGLVNFLFKAITRNTVKVYLVSWIKNIPIYEDHSHREHFHPRVDFHPWFLVLLERKELVFGSIWCINWSISLLVI